MNQPSPEIAHLCKIDPVMKRVIGEVGPYALSLRARRSPFESLARAIAYQQLHDKAAESILKRFIALFPGLRFPRPADLLAMAPEIIRGTGFSHAKIAALHDLAAKAMDGTVPTTTVIQRLEDDAIVERLVAVRGVGRWTVEMLLIFSLADPMSCRWMTLAYGTDSGSHTNERRCRLQKSCWCMENAGGPIARPQPGISGARRIGRKWCEQLCPW